MSDDPGRDYERVREWCATTAGARAGEVHSVRPGAWRLRTPDWPDSYVQNCLLLTVDPGPGDVVAMAAAATRGLRHQHVTAFCPLSDESQEALRHNGFEVQPEVFMHLPADAVVEPPVATDGARVHEVSPDHPWVRDLILDYWRTESSVHVSDATVAQLIERREPDVPGQAVRSFVVVADGAPTATVDLCTSGGVAELDGLATSVSARGRGHGRLAFLAAIGAARSAAAERVVLLALRDDWPREWYARLGFRELGPAYEATLVPTDGPA